MKKALRILGIVILSIVLLFFIGFLIVDEKLPEGEAGPEADLMAEQMLAALNKEAWDNTDGVSWTFTGIHDYDWDKENNVVGVKWDDKEVALQPASKTGIVANGENYSGAEVKEMVDTSWDFFNNDSFWLCAPYKVFDPGTVRSIVTLKDGRKGLKITYTSGGTTPGDSYVWILDDNYTPIAVKMWVSILPIGGIEFTWENYIYLSSGAMIAQDHWLYGAVNIDITNVQ